jgi:Histidine phosphatase superfamily (branch 1)
MMNHCRLVETFYNATFRHRIAVTTASSTSWNNGESLSSHPETNAQRQRSFISKRTFTSLNQSTPYNICFLRHGQSTWNRDNRFIGWTDTPLTDQGVLEARVAGQMLHTSNIQFDEVHTSLLRRSIRTTNIVLMEMAQEYIPVYKHWRLNERNYGALTGLNKKECVAKHGAEQVKRWRRSYDIPPPPMENDHPYHPRNDPRYRNVRYASNISLFGNSPFFAPMIIPLFGRDEY